MGKPAFAAIIIPTKPVGMMMRLLTCLFLLIASVLVTTQANAQDWPTYTSTTINDEAGLLDAPTRAEITQQLNTLRAETGIELVLLTIPRQDDYTYGTTPPPTIEDFATGVFNQWGIGDATRNDGILVLVAHKDREMRIELGKGYGQDWNRFAQNVLDRSFLPAFREDRYQDGIQAGMSDIITAIARPFHAGDDAPTSGPEVGWLLVLGAFAFFFGKPLATTLKTRLARCPNCNRRGLRHDTQTLRKPTATKAGKQQRRTTCRHCNHTDLFDRAIPPTKSSSSSSFGGGSSGGGGATGRW